MSQDSILVLDQYPQTLAIVRSLGRRGYHMVLGRCESMVPTYLEHSRYCGEVWIHPEYSDTQVFEHALRRFLAERPDVQTIFPAGEPATAALATFSGLENDGYSLVMVGKDLLEVCRDKHKANTLARDAGLHVPKSTLVQSLNALRAAIEDIGFPVVIKSVRTEARLLGRKALILGSEDELNGAFQEWPSPLTELLVQQYVEGRVEAANFVAAEGRVVAYQEAFTLRTDSPDGAGMGVDFESLEPTPDLLAAVKGFAATSAYSGPGLIQFVRSTSNRITFFIENNPRLAAGVQHALSSGLDLPWLTMQAFTAQSLREVDIDDFVDVDQSFGHRTHWLIRDLERFVANRNRINLVGRFTWLWNIGLSFVRADSHIEWQWRDPMPTIVRYLRFWTRLVRGVGRKLAK